MTTGTGHTSRGNDILRLRHALREYEHSTEPIKPWTKQRRCVPSTIRSRIQRESPT
jgi:argininosuccinate synthase